MFLIKIIGQCLKATSIKKQLFVIQQFLRGIVMSFDQKFDFFFFFLIAFNQAKKVTSMGKNSF